MKVGDLTPGGEGEDHWMFGILVAEKIDDQNSLTTRSIDQGTGRGAGKYAHAAGAFLPDKWRGINHFWHFRVGSSSRKKQTFWIFCIFPLSKRSTTRLEEFARLHSFM